MKAKPSATDESRFQNLVAKAGTMTRCYCGKQGYLAKVVVEVDARSRKRRYAAEWEHPTDPSNATVCQYVWP